MPSRKSYYHTWNWISRYRLVFAWWIKNFKFPQNLDPKWFKFRFSDIIIMTIWAWIFKFTRNSFSHYSTPCLTMNCCHLTHILHPWKLEHDECWCLVILTMNTSRWNESVRFQCEIHTTTMMTCNQIFMLLIMIIRDERWMITKRTEIFDNFAKGKIFVANFESVEILEYERTLIMWSKS